MNDRCQWKRCRSAGQLTYMGRPLCDRHWAEFCRLDEDGRLDAALARIGMTREQRDRANRLALGTPLLPFALSACVLAVVLVSGCTQPRPVAPDKTPEMREIFEPSFLDLCWYPLPADAWRLRSRSFGNWHLCMAGPGEPAGPYAKAYFDTDADGDVDLMDFARLQRGWQR